MKSRDGKRQRGKSESEEKVREEEIKEEKVRESQQKEGPGAQKGRKVAKQCVFSMTCSSGGSRSRLVKDERVARRCGTKKNSNLNVQSTPKWDHVCKLRYRKSARSCGAKHISKSKRTKHTNIRPLWELYLGVETVYAVLVRSTSPSPNVQPTSTVENFWKLQCRQKFRPFWREAHVKVKSVQN